MPAKAISKKIGAKNPVDFSTLTLAERVSLRKFSLSFVALQAVPAGLVAIFVIIAGTKYGYFTLKTGLLGLLGLLVGFYLMMPRMANKIIDGIMAFRAIPKEKRDKILKQKAAVAGI